MRLLVRAAHPITATNRARKPRTRERRAFVGVAGIRGTVFVTMAPDFGLRRFEATRAELGARVRVTPLVPAEGLRASTGCSVYLKAESLQITHAFKIRAAYGALLPRLEDARKRGVVTGSSGNFAQGLAYAGRELGVPVTVVMLERSASYKVEATKRLGAEVVFCPNDFAQRPVWVERIQREQGKLALSSYDDEETILGNGSLALEIVEQCPEADVVLAPASGGGLLAGVAAVIKQRRPQAKVYGVQPEVIPAMKRSLERGEPTEVPNAESVADGIAANKPGKVTFPIIRKYVDDVLLVSEREIVEAMAHLFEQDKLVVEPAGAVAVAALRRYGNPAHAGRNIVAILSGGNVEPKRFQELVDSVTR
jgi:threonine dehydratase